MGCAKTVETIGGDVLATATGNPELIPLINGGVSLANGGGIKGALIAGGEALAGQELAGAVGIGGGNSFVNDALGIDISPAATGLPDIGGGISDAIGSIGKSLGFSSGNAGTALDSTNAAGSAVDAGGNVLAAPASTTTALPAAGAGGTISAGNIGSFDLNTINSQLGQAPVGSGTDFSSLNGFGGGAAGAASDSALAGAVPGAVPIPNLQLGANAALGAASTDAIGSVPSLNIGDVGNVSGASGGFLNNLESSAGKALIPAAGLAYEAAKGPAKLPSQAAALESGGAATAPLLGLETSAANEASTGQLTQTQQANVEQFVNEQHNQLIQQLASQGISNPTKSSQYQAGLADIKKQALAMQQDYITQAINTATSAGGAASSNIAAVAGEQVQQDKDYQDALAQAFAALGGSIGARA